MQRSSGLHMSCPLTPMGANVIVTVEENKSDGQVSGSVLCLQICHLWTIRR